MDALSWPSIGPYCAFSIFVYYQQLHARDFRGASQFFHAALATSGFLGMITGLAYLVYYGYRVAWWAPVVIFAVSLLTMLVGVLAERAIGAFAISMCAFVGWPICAYFMFVNIPA